MLTLTPNQARALRHIGSLHLLAEIVGDHPGETEFVIDVSDAAGERTGRTVKRHLADLVQAGIITDEYEPSSRRRRIRLLCGDTDFAEWWRTSRAARQWPAFWPEGYDQLAAEHDGMDRAEFDAVVRHSLTDALVRADVPASIYSWVRTALARHAASPAARPPLDPEEEVRRAARKSREAERLLEKQFPGWYGTDIYADDREGDRP